MRKSGLRLRLAAFFENPKSGVSLMPSIWLFSFAIAILLAVTDYDLAHAAPLSPGLASCRCAQLLCSVSPLSRWRRRLSRRRLSRRSLSRRWLPGGAYRGGVYRGGAYRGGVYRGGVYRGGVYRGGVYRGGVYRGWRSVSRRRPLLRRVLRTERGGEYRRGRWWPYGVGSCWRPSPIGYVWICG